jgi:hypothetical protein
VWVGVASELVIVSLIVYVPVMQDIFDTGSIPAAAWLWLVPLIPLVPLADAARKAIRTRHPPIQKQMMGT